MHFGDQFPFITFVFSSQHIFRVITIHPSIELKGVESEKTICYVPYFPCVIVYIGTIREHYTKTLWKCISIVSAQQGLTFTLSRHAKYYGKYKQELNGEEERSGDVAGKVTVVVDVIILCWFTNEFAFKGGEEGKPEETPPLLFFSASTTGPWLFLRLSPCDLIMLLLLLPLLMSKSPSTKKSPHSVKGNGGIRCNTVIPKDN